jgi:hypothetical protein
MCTMTVRGINYKDIVQTSMMSQCRIWYVNNKQTVKIGPIFLYNSKGYYFTYNVFVLILSMLNVQPIMIVCFCSQAESGELFDDVSHIICSFGTVSG